jgi:hypothetical protein
MLNTVAANIREFWCKTADRVVIFGASGFMVGI